MQQRKISDEEDEEMKRRLGEVMERSRWTNSGFAFDSEKNLKTFDHGIEERERYYEKLWEQVNSDVVTIQGTCSHLSGRLQISCHELRRRSQRRQSK
jgi:hypothetical protein